MIQAPEVTLKSSGIETLVEPKRQVPIIQEKLAVFVDEPRNVKEDNSE